MPATKIGDKVIRVDAIEKARGEATYVCDMTLPDMQYAYMVRSTVPRGTIDAIHLPEMPEGYYFISAKDIPAQGKNELWMIMIWSRRSFRVARSGPTTKPMVSPTYST